MKLFFLFFVLSLSLPQAKSQIHNISLVDDQILLSGTNGTAYFSNLSSFFEGIQKQNNGNIYLEIQVFSDLIIDDNINWYRNLVFYSNAERRNRLNFTGMGVIKSAEGIFFSIKNFEFKRNSSIPIEAIFIFENSIQGNFKVFYKKKSIKFK